MSASALDRPAAARLPREQRRAQLLEAARVVFIAAGYHAASMDDIAETAGVSKPVLYQHFPGKLDLYLAVLDQAVDELVERINRALRDNPDNKKRVQATMSAYFSFVGHREGAYRLVFEGDLTNDPQVRERVNRLDDLIARAIADVIAEDTGLSAQEAFILGSGLQGMAQTAARRWIRLVTPASNGDERVSQEQAADVVTALAWKGISSFPLSHPPQ